MNQNPESAFKKQNLKRFYNGITAPNNFGRSKFNIILGDQNQKYLWEIETQNNFGGSNSKLLLNIKIAIRDKIPKQG